MELPQELATPMFSRLWKLYRDQPRISWVERRAGLPTSGAFQQETMATGYPVVFTGTVVNRDWESAVAILRSTCEGHVVQVRQADYHTLDEYVRSRQRSEVRLLDYLAELEARHDSAVGYAGNVRLPDSAIAALGISPPACIDQQSLEPPACWLGPKGSVTPLHKDSTPNFALQIAGTKIWSLYPVRDAIALSLSRPDQGDMADFATSALTIDQLPPALECVLHPGELLYLPAGWSHAVTNLSDSLMVNYWMKKQAYLDLLETLIRLTA